MNNIFFYIYRIVVRGLTEGLYAAVIIADITYNRTLLHGCHHLTSDHILLGILIPAHAVEYEIHVRKLTNEI